MGVESVTAPPRPLTLKDQGAKEYRKTATVHAIQMPSAFTVETKEGVMKGEPGDWLCQGPGGEMWPIKKEIFEKTYVEVYID